MSDRDFGPQPLEAVMARLKLTNHDLVKASTEQLTYKIVAKGCKGRKLTPNTQQKILAALQILRPEENLTLKEIFNY